MSLLDSEPIPRRTMVLFFVIDTSGSMRGDKIGSANRAIEEVVPMLKDISATNADAQIKIAVLKFSSGAEWIYPQPVEMESFVWHDLETGGVTDMGEACKELNQKLSREAFMMNAIGSLAPVIILLSDGAPTDSYKTRLKELKDNNWFKAAIKIAIAIGEDAKLDILKEFTGNAECVVPVRNTEELRKIIRFASVTASQIGSKSTKAGSESKQDEVAKQLQEYLPSIKDTQNIPDVDISGW
jgi:uncharacterized protein YegL